MRRLFPSRAGGLAARLTTRRQSEQKLSRRIEELENRVARLRQEGKGRPRSGSPTSKESKKSRERGTVPKHKVNPLGTATFISPSPHMTIGRDTTVVTPCRVLVFPGEAAMVRVGAFSGIGPETLFMVGANHRTDYVTTFAFPAVWKNRPPESKGDIVIGNDVWIGREARILSGVTIGNGAVVGAFAVVASDVRPYSVVVGNPAREVSRRFSDEQIVALERIAWWEWPYERIQAEVQLLSSADVDFFIERAESGREDRPPSAGPESFDPGHV